MAKGSEKALAEEKRKLGIEQKELEREKQGFIARELGGRRAALGRSAQEQLGMQRSSGLMSTPEQSQRAKDIELVALNETRAQQALANASRGPAKQQPVFPYVARAIDPLAAEKQQVAAAKEDIRRVNRGERPLLQEIKLPEKKKYVSPF